MIEARVMQRGDIDQMASQFPEASLFSGIAEENRLNGRAVSVLIGGKVCGIGGVVHESGRFKVWMGVTPALKRQPVLVYRMLRDALGALDTYPLYAEIGVNDRSTQRLAGMLGFEHEAERDGEVIMVRKWR